MYRTIVLVVLAVVAMATTSTQACSTRLSARQFRQLYCSADVVFRGMQVGGSSSVGIDQNGREMQGGRFTFQVSRAYKGSPGSMADVSRMWTQGDPCPAAAFPDRSSDFLVFSKGGSVETCRHSFPWSCVPAGFKNSLPIRC
ncbi:hypothetical protein EGW08_020101 [Elysia chlorotica]|uniref:NTR domain-containing protein n=1 Tax=Elysia chlorotica TaxID=188477 RepID=A0A433SSB3_ELYCH|nr:hypothetical protein EGW08_020101 [Elysia chlorotica]